MADEHTPIGLGGQMQNPPPLDGEASKTAASSNKTAALTAVLSAKSAIETIEANLAMVEGDDALAGAHCTLRTVASILGAESIALGG